MGLDEVFPGGLLRQVADEIPEAGLEAERSDVEGCLPHYPLCSHSFRGEWGLGDPKQSGLNYLLHEWSMPPATQELFGLLRSDGWVDFLQTALGIEGLIPD